VAASPRAVAPLTHGRGTLIDDDVRLGSGVDGGSGGTIEIGVRAKIRGASEISNGVRIGDRFDAGHNVFVGEGTVIGDDCRISSNTYIGPRCTIGSRVIVDANCYISEFTTIEDDVRIAPGACLASDPHPGSESHLCERGPTIQRGAQVGMNATILPFVTIGERSLVAAGSVVTKDVPPCLVVAGNPARILKAITQITCPLDLEQGEYLRARPVKNGGSGRSSRPS
jgi:acetyltransferase-like isoleucine patch superfamily enzyme